MKQPDVLVIVLDCVRASDFVGGWDFRPRLPFIESLIPELIAFPRAASVAPWTLPSHASLLSGRYPWDNPTWTSSNGDTSKSPPGIARTFASNGYRTLLLSANFAVLNRKARLADGFQAVASGNSWDFCLRTGGDRTMFSRKIGEVQTPEYREGQIAGNRQGGPWENILGELPRACLLLSRVIQKLRQPGKALDLRVGPWIEPTLESWLTSRSKSDPVFCTINLADAHEPYYQFCEPSDKSSALVQGVTSHGRAAWFTGRWKPTARELAALRAGYWASLIVLDRRVKSVVEAFMASREWDNTILVLTSDHGQAFGEAGMVYHSQRVTEPVIRIPLFLRVPTSGYSGVRAAGWASLVDIAPTLLHLAGITSGTTPSSVNLLDLVDSQRSTPIFARSEGISHLWEQSAAPEIRAASGGIQVAAYFDEFKVVVRGTGSDVRAYRVAQDPYELTDVLPTTNGRLSDVVRSAVRVSRLRGTSTSTKASDGLSGRLQSWGYS